MDKRRQSFGGKAYEWCVNRLYDIDSVVIPEELLEHISKMLYQ